MRLHRTLALLLALPALACSSSDDDKTATPAPDAGATPMAPMSALTPDEQAMVRTLSPIPELPKDTTNRFADDERAARLGQKLFFDATYSGPLAVGNDGSNGAVGAMGESGKLSCASCHSGPALDDRRSQPGKVSLGAGLLPRNALPLVNSSHYRWVNWAGRFSAQWELPLAVAENAANMNSSRLRIAHVVFDKYRADYEAIFGALDPALGADAMRFPPSGKPKADAMSADGPWEMMAMADRDVVLGVAINFGKALEAYMRKLTSRGSRFDDFVGGKAQALSADEVAGLRVFLGKGKCASCHKGPRFTDDDFHNIGSSISAMDTGRAADGPSLFNSATNSASKWSDDAAEGMKRLAGLSAMLPPETQGRFRTPSLRNVSRTAPYMHAGQLPTLEAVVDYYDKGGEQPLAGTKDAMLGPLGLTAQEKANLVAFLRALDMDAAPEAWTADPGAK